MGWRVEILDSKADYYKSGVWGISKGSWLMAETHYFENRPPHPNLGSWCHPVGLTACALIVFCGFVCVCLRFRWLRRFMGFRGHPESHTVSYRPIMGRVSFTQDTGVSDFLRFRTSLCPRIDPQLFQCGAPVPSEHALCSHSIN